MLTFCLLLHCLYFILYDFIITKSFWNNSELLKTFDSGFKIHYLEPSLEQANIGTSHLLATLLVSIQIDWIWNNSNKGLNLGLVFSSNKVFHKQPVNLLSVLHISGVARMSGGELVLTVTTFKKSHPIF